MLRSAHRGRAIVLSVILLLLNTLVAAAGPGGYEINPRVDTQRLKKFNLDRNFHRCLSVIDGDTIVLEGLGAVRFIGIDTPEKNHPMLPLQFMAHEASAFTKKHCLGKKIRLDYDPHDDDFRGKYGRVLGYVYLEDGTFLQEALVRKGLAAAYTRYPMDESIKQRLLTAQKEARRNDVGLWRNNGFAEIEWILENKTPMVRVGFKNRGVYELSTAGWSLQPIAAAHIADRVAELHRWMHEFSPYDFEKKVRAAGYQRVEKPDSDAFILLFGMAHKKWGAFYNGYSRARVEQDDLAAWLDEFGAMLATNAEPDELVALLPDRGFRFFNLLEYDPLGLIADATPAGLTRIPFSTNKGRLIPWQRASRHIGRSVVVHGRIVRTHNSGKACFLNFHTNFTRYMSAVIFRHDFNRYAQAPEALFLGRYVAIKGKIKVYEGKPEIVITDPGQIVIIDERN